MKNKIQVFESGWSVFASIWYFCKEKYWCGEHSNIIFLVNGTFLFITKITPNPMKNDIIVGNTFGVLFEVEIIWHKIVSTSYKEVKDANEENQRFHCFEMLEKSYNF